MKKYIICLIFLLYDAVTVLASFYIALWTIYGEKESIPAVCTAMYRTTMPCYLLAVLLFYVIFKLYNSLWRQVSYYELINFSLAAFIPVAGYFFYDYITEAPLPRRYFAIGGVIQWFLLILSRFSCRITAHAVIKYRQLTARNTLRARAMLIGAGAAGQIILRDVYANSESEVDILCVIDDDPGKRHCRMCGVPVVGNRNDILCNVKKYRIEEILFAIPAISAKAKRDILNICQASGCKIKILPGITSLINGDVTLTQMRDVTIEELLGREPVRVNTEEILNNLSGKVILVTGGGGSIGSELCRQIAGHNPEQLVIFDIYENNAYDIEQELRHTYPALNLSVLIGSVRDTRRIRQVFAAVRPEIVFHAAAHKHVPLMEESPCEAIKNNVLGTYKTACAAILNGCRKFVLISTDKAVNPTNIMGASKRLCEMVIQTMDKISRNGDYHLLPSFLSSHSEEENGEPETLFSDISGHTEFVAVRFGNVLGSNGSVIPLFKKQISMGGPVTVTHPDIIRYFMTIPEAVSLVLEAGTYAKGGEIFVLDMGEPVKIDTLARNLIKLSGFVPDEDIEIEYSGLRPGEKLFEEKLMAEEGLSRTRNDLIHIAKPLDWEPAEFLTKLEKLARASCSNCRNVHQLVSEIVTTFKIH